MDASPDPSAALLDDHPARGLVAPAAVAPTPRLQAALAKFQQQLPKLKYDSTARLSAGREYRYASLHALLDAVVPALAKLGVTTMQHLSHEGGWVYVTTVLSLGEESQSCCLGAPLERGGFHELGSAITYLKRYSLASMVGIAGEEDDDAHTAQGVETSPPPAKEQGRSIAPPRQRKAKAATASSEGRASSPAPSGDGVVVTAKGQLVSVELRQSKKGTSYLMMTVDDMGDTPAKLFLWGGDFETILDEVKPGCQVSIQYEPGDYPKIRDIAYQDGEGRWCCPGLGPIPF